MNKQELLEIIGTKLENIFTETITKEDLLEDMYEIFSQIGIDEDDIAETEEENQEVEAYTYNSYDRF